MQVAPYISPDDRVYSILSQLNATSQFSFIMVFDLSTIPAARIQVNLRLLLFLPAPSTNFLSPRQPGTN